MGQVALFHLAILEQVMIPAPLVFVDGKQNQAGGMSIDSVDRSKSAQAGFLHQMVQEAFPYEFPPRNHGQEMRLAGDEDMIVPVEDPMEVRYARLGGNLPEVPDLHSGRNLGQLGCAGSVAQPHFAFTDAAFPGCLAYVGEMP